jgi:PAS domain S-box-containing protein
MIPEADATVLDSINEGVFTVDTNWRITFFNRAAERITNVPRNEALGRPCSDVFRADICERGCPLARTMDTGTSIVRATANIVGAEGHTIPICVSTSLLTDEHGRVVGGVETFQDLTQVEQLRKELTSRYTFEDIVGSSAAMQRLFDVLPRIADSASTVLVEGPSGTGKELFARAIHNLSPRREGPFVAVNCGALPDTLLESELFGYKSGAFTDAKRDKPGRFAMAHGGTIFLDEIGDVSTAMQVRLLRVLQERVVEPVGGVEPEPVDIRVIAATNRPLDRLVADGAFREDLYYRIKVIRLALPPLCERREDIPLLVDHIVARFNSIQDKDIAGVSDQVLEVLMQHDYPGNIRELENIIEQAFVLCRGPLIELHHLPPELRPEDGATRGAPMTLEAMEEQLITEALARHRGNRTRAARELGIDPSTLYRKIKALGISPPESDGRASTPVSSRP